MKILCVGNFKSPSNAWMRVRTLMEMGYDVHPVNMSRRSFLQGNRLNKYTLFFPRRIFVKQLDVRFIQAVRYFNPEVIYFEKAQWLRPRIIRNIRENARSNVRLLHYNPDEFFGENSPKRWGYFVESIPEYDVHFVPKIKNIEDYIQHGAKKVFSVNRSYDPKTHRPISLSLKEKKRYGAKIGFIGSCAPYREEVIYRLILDGYDVKIWGGGWNRGKYWDVLKTKHQGEGYYGEEYSKVLNGIEIVLHFLRRENRDFQDSRTYEIPACGRFMLAEWSPDHETLFKDGQDAVLFRSYEELRDKLDHYLKHPEERAQIARNGCEVITRGGNRHRDRLQYMLDRGLE